jgi:glutamate synthase domain-containing protein 2
MVRQFYIISFVVLGLIALMGVGWPPAWWAFVLAGPVFLLGVADSLQRKQAVRRNFPVIGHFRYLLEMIRPEINQYFIESNMDGTPFNRETRSIVYQRAKLQLQTLPFGTQRDVYEPGYEWINHSLGAKHANSEAPRIRIGEETCRQPYDASLLNISAMSYGSLSSAAIRALNGGARIGGFYHNTGEGGISPHHLAPGGDLTWQVGTGYFGCRNADGTFDPESFKANATRDTVKMIEVKLSQGAKPGHGGILPAAKITDEIASIRGVSKGQDVLSPPGHSSFDSPRGLLEFVAKLRELSGGKPTGFKFCVGHPAEFLSVCMAMRETGLRPDFITVDGCEGGTGAAPLEFSNSIGAPLTEGLVFVHNALVGFDLRSKIRVIASGKIITAFNMAARLAAGADMCNSARGFMFALGCIQARRCNSNHCPVGVATQQPSLVRGLDVTDKTHRVANFHHETIHAFLEVLGAAGLSHPSELRPMHIYRRVSETRVETYAEIYRYLSPGDLVSTTMPGKHWSKWMGMASVDRFVRVT